MASGPYLSRRLILGASAGLAAAVPIEGGLAAAAPRPPAVGDTVPTDALRVSTLGHDPADSTEFLQAALDSDAATVVIDYVPGGWVTGPLFLRRGNVTIIIESGVTVRAKPGGFSGLNDALLTIDDQTMVTLSGYGATFAMNKTEYTDGEWRHCLNIRSSFDVTVEGLTLRDSGGDGVYLGTTSQRHPNTRVVLRDLISDNHRRQGISVISASELLIEGCALTNTQGTLPEAGIDFEPNTALERLQGIVLRDCVIANNRGGAISLYGGKLDSTTPTISIRIEETTITGQQGVMPQIRVHSQRGDGVGVMAGGQIEFRDLFIDTTAGSGALMTRGIEPEGIMTVLDRVTVRSQGNARYTHEVFQSYSHDHLDYGNLTLTDTTVVTDQPGPYLAADAVNGTTLHNITGNVRLIAGDSPADPEFGPDPENVDLVTTVVADPAPATVTVSVGAAEVSAGDDVAVTFTRTGGEVAAPLAVTYTTLGTARERYDYGGLGHVVIIPAGDTSVTKTIRTFPRRRDIDPESSSLIIAVAGNPLYHSDSFAKVTLVNEAPNVPADGVVGSWLLDETSGTVAVDAMGNSNGDCTDIEFGRTSLVVNDTGTASYLNGTTALVSIPYVPKFTLPEYSLVLYFSLHSAPVSESNRVLVSKEPGAGGMSIEIYNDYGSVNLRAYTRNAAGTAVWIGSKFGVAPVAIDTTYRVVLTVGADEVALYLDDTVVGTSTTDQGWDTSTRPLCIGAYNGAASPLAHANATVDNISLHDHALTAAEVEALPAAHRA